MPDHYRHLGVYCDLVAAARRKQSLYTVASPGPHTQALIREVLGFQQEDESPREVQVESEWEKDGLVGQEISWPVGHGLRTQAYLLKPARANRPLPGMIIAISNITGRKKFRTARRIPRRY